jgi:hypothetical protein
MQNQVIEARDSDGRGIRVEFFWRGDRYGHTVSRIETNGAISPLLESVEGHSDDGWPDSPPLQTLSREMLPDGRPVALLVGMAGRGHWSASVEPIAGQAMMVFDVACRYAPSPGVIGPPPRLQSRYFARSPFASAHLSIDGGSATIPDVSNVLQISPPTIAPQGTTRWRYTIDFEY